ncbi:MAG: hypothetical protein DWQ07_17610 [Chloroflexi bacterium]|nr:MAG: hypothetical protein DWQ07_17610 [Chloroflexota bacterium]
MDKYVHAYITALLRPATRRGRLLFAGWPKETEAGDFKQQCEALNAEASVVCQDETAAAALTAVGVTAFCGDLLRDLEGSHGQFSALCVDSALLLAEKPAELDRNWRTLMHAASYMQAGAILAFRIERQQLLDNPRWLTRLLGGFRDLQLFQEDASTLLVVGRRRGTRGQVTGDVFNTLLKDVQQRCLPSSEALPSYKLPNEPQDRRLWFRSRMFDPAQMEQMAQRLPWPANDLSTALFGHQAPEIQPILPLRATHLGAVVASGALGTLRLTSPASGRDVVLRGRTLRRERKEVVDTNEDATEDTVYDLSAPPREQLVADFITEISILDLDTAEIEQVNPSESDAMQAFLEEWGEALANVASASYPVTYDPRETPYWELLEGPLARLIDQPLRSSGGTVVNLSGTDEPSLTIPQRHLLAGLFLKMLGKEAVRPEKRSSLMTQQQLKRFILSGEPAVGKTMIALRLLAGLVMHEARKEGRKIGQRGWPLCLFVTTLANVDHVVREARIAAPLFVPRVVENLKDLRYVLAEAERSTAPILMVVSRTRLRAADQIEPAYSAPTAMQRHEAHDEQYVDTHCPRCGEAFEAPKQLVKKWNSRYLTGSRLAGRGRKCTACSSPLYQQVHGTRSLAWALRRAMRKGQARLLGFIGDEIHQDKGASNQGQSMAWLAEEADYALGMSGTVYGGVPSDVFLMLHRLIPSFRRSWGWNERSTFIGRFGNWRKVIKEDGSWGQLQELPGISPELTAGIFLSYAAFFTVTDAGMPMPEREELPVEVKPSDEEQVAQERLIKSIQAEIEAEGDAIEKKLTANSRNAQLLRLAPVGWHRPELARVSPAWSCPVCKTTKLVKPRCPHVWHIPDVDEALPEDIDPAMVVSPVLDPAWRASEEHALLKILAQEQSERRSTLIFPYHTGRYALHERLNFVLSDAGYRVLNAGKIPSRHLEKRINHAPMEGYDAIVCNPGRVSTGPNLARIPTLVWYQPLWSAQAMMQGSDRIDRPTQLNNVRIYHIVGQQSAEMVVLARAVEKMIAVHLLAGTDYQGMAAVLDTVGHTESFQEAMIRYVSDRVETDLSTLFESLRAVEGQRAAPAHMASVRSTSASQRIAPLNLDRGQQLSLFPPTSP